MRTLLMDDGAGREGEQCWGPATMWGPGEPAFGGAAMVRLEDEREGRARGCGREGVELASTGLRV